MNPTALPIDPVTPPASARKRVEDVWSLIAPEMHQVETRLCEQLDSPVGRIPEVGGHLLAAGGKRLRPVLSVLSARACGADVDMAVSAGCAAELIHTATLFHDDVVDGGQVRRGRPAARMVYGNGVAVLVGDFCLARGLELVAKTGAMAMVRSLASTVTEMAEGEVAQLEGAGNADAGIDGYMRVIDRKTASLMDWCARVGGVLPPSFDAPMGRFGRAVGRAFQIVDDLLDCALDGTASGKTPGRDLQEGKLTLPVLLACDTDAGLRARIRECMGEHGVPADQAREILAKVAAAGGLERARRRALDLADTAVSELGVLSPSSYKDALVEVARLSVDRVA